MNLQCFHCRVAKDISDRPRWRRLLCFWYFRPTLTMFRKKYPTLVAILCHVLDTNITPEVEARLYFWTKNTTTAYVTLAYRHHTYIMEGNLQCMQGWRCEWWYWGTDRKMTRDRELRKLANFKRDKLLKTIIFSLFKDNLSMSVKQLLFTSHALTHGREAA